MPANSGLSRRCSWLIAVLLTAAPALGARTLYVSPHGDDTWSGTLPAPNASRNDGPLASLARARDVIRQLKTNGGGLKQAVRVQIRGGTYPLAETLSLEPVDSGTAECPVSYEAFPGEQPILCGGAKISGWKPYRGSIRSVSLPEVQAGKWYFRSLFAGGARQIRARYPNFDPSDPYRKGFLYVDRDPDGFGLAVGNIHNRGDWMEYQVQVPSDGQYAYWLHYAALNATYGQRDMGGRTVIIVDGQQPLALLNLPDTGGWTRLKWSHAASVALTKGPHRLRWQNVKGGGLTFASFALCDDPDWKPGKRLAQAAAGKHLVVVQAVNFVRYAGKQLSVHGTAEGATTRFCYAPGTFKPAWARAADAEVHIFQSGSCRAFKEIVAIAKIDEPARTVTVAGKECVARLQPGDRYFLENLFEELDSPGEWYLDRRSGQLFYWPRAETDLAGVVAPRLGRLVQLIGNSPDEPVRHVHLAGLTFQETDYSPDDGCVGYCLGSDGVVYLKNAVACRVEGCVFRNIGRAAVCLSASSQIAVEGNEVACGAEGGVLILDSARNTVADNHIHHCGAVYKHVGGVVLEGLRASENTIAHNAIHDISRYGISMKNAGLRNRVEYNRVQNTNLETYDTGGIEVTQQDRQLRSGTVIRNNIVADTIGYSSAGPKPVFLSWGIYLDSFAGGYTVTHNVVYRNANGGIMLQGGKDNTIENNIFVDGKFNQGHISNFSDNSTGQALERNIIAYRDPDAVLFSVGRLRDDVIRIGRNLYFHRGKELRVWGGGVTSWADWQKRGFDGDSLLSDPRFVDPARDNFSLRPDSPALRLGFEPIDTSQVGPRHHRCECRIEPAAPSFGLW
jgi:parallel beta-helix repeat protein